MHGAPALPAGFAHLPYADPNAPQGGRVKLGEVGGFDSLNPHIRRGRFVWAMRTLVFESLLGRSYDEPFSLYGLLAEGVSTPPDRSSVSFILREEARFSNGAPVTVEDVIWSMETLRDKGRPNYRAMYGQVASVERIGERGVRFIFKQPNRELPLLIGLMPIHSKAAWAGKTFDAGGLTPPIGSGPYVPTTVEGEQRIVFAKNPDYWGAGLAFNRGRHNFEEIEYLYFRDGDALWQAFTAGAVDFYFDRKGPAHWAGGYDFPAYQRGDVQRGEIRHSLPSGMRGFVFNTRRAPFADRRVRQALSLAFDFAWINERFDRGANQRIQSYFSGADLGFKDPASPAERALLAPLIGAEGAMLTDAMLDQGWRAPDGAGDGRNRRNLRQARALLAEAGWTIANGVLQDAGGAPFRFEILVASNSDERIAQAYGDMLKPLGIAASVRFIDSAQYQERLTQFDYDMIAHYWYASLSPGEEQRHYWGSAAATTEGTRNYAGVQDPAVDAMIDALIAAQDRPSFAAAAQALDRALAAGVYTIPFGYLPAHRVAWWTRIDKPADAALYGFRPDVWWRADGGNQ